MAMGSGLLALALLAAQGPSCSPGDATTFQVRVLTLDGLSWRTTCYSRLQPVARQGTSTVWTADKALLVTLSERARSSTNFGTVVSTSDATLTRCEAVNYVASMERFADGPINQSSAIGFMPRPERLDERFAVKLNGRKLDQGVLTQLALEETHVEVIHAISQVESVLPIPSRTTRTATEFGRDLFRVVASADPREWADAIACTVQVPEVTQAKVEGEWLIPNNGVLLVSLGVKTVADDQGKAVVRERVAVIEAIAGQASPNAQVGAAEAVARSPIAMSRLAMPAIPARAQPIPIGPDGEVAEAGLPPLPEGFASTDLDRIKPDPNQPSPQAPDLSGPARDAALARTSFSPSTPVEKAEFDVESDKAEARIIFLEKIIDALERAGVCIDVDARVGSPVFQPIKPSRDARDADATTCPVCARVAPAEVVEGGTRVAPRASAPFEISPKDLKGLPVCGGSTRLSEALKAPGRTETTMIPLGGNLALEIKATVVPAPSKTQEGASKDGESLTAGLVSKPEESVGTTSASSKKADGPIRPR